MLSMNLTIFRGIFLLDFSTSRLVRQSSYGGIKMSRVRIGKLTEEQRDLIKKTQKINDEIAIKEFIKSRTLKNVRPTTIRYYEDVFHVMRRDFDKLGINKQLIEVDEEDIKTMIELWQHKLKVTSINSKIRGIRPFYSFLKDKGWIKKNPIEKIELLRDRSVIRETLENHEIKKISNYFKNQESFTAYRNLVIFQLLLDTGIRINECLNIRRNDIDGKRLVVVESKNLQQRIVFLSERMITTLKAYIKLISEFDLHHDYIFINQDKGRLAQSTYQEQLREAARAVGIKKQVSPHVCRRTFAKRAVMRGMDPFTLQVLLGHSTLEVTKRYVQIYGQDLEKQAQKKEDFSDLF